MSEDGDSDSDARDYSAAATALFAGECRFLIGAASTDDLPVHPHLEVAFAGRSNVGKSSLLNALVGRRDIARTSKEPGRTRELNFFLQEGKGGKSAMIVDLPGYGYAKAPKPVVARWTALINRYLAGRAPLRRVFLLIDSRHGIKAADEDVLKLLDTAAVSYQVVLTKTDKITAPERAKVIAKVADDLRKHPAAHPEIIATSSLKRDGIDRLRAEVARLAEGG